MQDMSEANCAECNGTFAVNPRGLAPNDEHTDGVFCPFCGELNDFDRVDEIRKMRSGRWEIAGGA